MMALNTTTFFTVLGKYIKNVNVFNGLLSTIQTGSDDIETILESNNLTRLFGPIPNLFNGFKANVVLWIERMNGLVSEIITDRDFVREQIPVQGEDLNSILLALIEYINDESDSVTASVISVGSVSDNVTSTTIGDLVIDTTLDGVTSPLFGGIATKEYRGLTSQMAVPSDTIYALCVAKASDGQETWNLFSTAAKTAGYQIQDEAAGPGPSIQTANSDPSSLGVGNSDFETFTTTNVPDSWTMTGTVTTDYLENNAAKYVFRGSSSLRINTSGTALKQQVFSTVPNKLYMTSLQVGRNDADPASSALDIVLSVENSDGSTVYFTKTTTINLPASSSDVFVPAYLHWYLDDQYDPNDVYVKVLINNFALTPTVAYLDEVVVSAPSYHNGVNFSILRGVDEFSVGDRFAVTITNNEAGVIQSYFRKGFGVQLPTSGSPTIADSLAT